MLLHRQLRDGIPVHPGHYRLHKEWILSASEREKAFASRKELTERQYNTKAHPLPQLAVQTAVLIQSGRRWNRTGRIVEVLPNRQYRVRVDGSGRVTLGNRRFLRANDCRGPVAMPAPSKDPPKLPAHSTTPASDTQTAPAPRMVPAAPAAGGETEAPEVAADATGAPREETGAPRGETDEPEAAADTPQAVPTLMPPDNRRRLPKALRDLADHNSRRVKEGQCDVPGRPRSGC